mmetsp:Transcript_6324/g.13831  ORF Transcript_6324/g.13831 Transcript_6324/m.13831 type:complete len:249 (+) Transcript_6324:79-825(+)
MGDACSVARADDVDGLLFEEVHEDSDDWREVSELLRARQKNTRHYGSVIELKRLLRILPSEVHLDLEEEALKAKMGEPTRLFHGTEFYTAESIVREGFRLPDKSGLFGRGIYFAEDPLKSVRYSKPKSKSKSSGSWPLWQALFGPRDLHRMLLCDVYLGKQKTCRSGGNKLSPMELRRHPWMRKLGAKDYDSVRAPGGIFGAVKVTEHVVYHRFQALPRFLIEFETVRACHGCHIKGKTKTVASKSSS